MSMLLEKADGKSSGKSLLEEINVQLDESSVSFLTRDSEAVHMKYVAYVSRSNRTRKSSSVCLQSPLHNNITAIWISERINRVSKVVGILPCCSTLRFA